MTTFGTTLLNNVERRAIDRAAQGLPAESCAELAAYIDTELRPLMDALKGAAISLHYHASRETNPMVREETKAILNKLYDAMGAPEAWKLQ